MRMERASLIFRLSWTGSVREHAAHILTHLLYSLLMRHGHRTEQQTYTPQAPACRARREVGRWSIMLMSYDFVQ